MNIIEIVDNMSQELYLRLKHAAETGKWPEGTPVDQAQRESALQLSMAYQSRHLNSDEMMSIGPTGEMVNKSKRELKDTFVVQDKELTPCDKTKTAADITNEQNNIARFTDL